MLKHLTIRSRLVAVIGFLALQLIVGAIIGIGALSVANRDMQTIYDARLVTVGNLNTIIRYLNRNEIAISKAVTGSQDDNPKIIAQVKERNAEIDKLWSSFIALPLGAAEKKLADEFTAHRKKYDSEAVKAAIDALQNLDTQGAIDAAQGPMTKLFEPMRSSMDSLIKLQLENAKKEYEASQSRYELVRSSCIVGLLFGVALAIWTGWWMVQAISHPLESAVKIAEAVAGGDLTREIEVRSDDEIGKLMQALKNMNDSLVRIVSQVRNSTDTIATASGEISAGNHDLSQRTEQQAASLEETASSMEELTSTVKQNADNARQANTLANSASEVASKGGAVVTEVVQTMGSINESSKKIVDIISVIDGIAFQTNILALNAAVEAARAGEQGRGFAVVAAEVRNLAQRSATAAKEIKALIDDSVQKVESGSKLVDQAGATMEEIVASVRRVTDIMEEIAAASQEQTSGIEQVNEAITQVDAATQQNAALVEQAASAAESLQHEAGNLAQLVAVFQLHHGAAPVAVAPPPKKEPAPARAPAAGRALAARKPAAPARREAPKVVSMNEKRITTGSGKPVDGGDWEEF